ncbi:MAG TPA: tetratricopeptide repeat protein [Fimbriimonas sp.]|nr:tetratricopeptide repeat protein [Fimbriimonas sp.]
MLPRPECWPLIESSLKQQQPSTRNLRIQAIFARLQGNDRDLLRICDLLAKSAANGIGYPELSKASIDMIRFQTLRRLGDVPAALNALVAASSAHEERWFRVPALAGIADDQSVKGALRKILVNSGGSIEVLDPATLHLAKAAALQCLPLIKSVPESLAYESDPVFLHALVAHYGPEKVWGLSPKDSQANAFDPYFQDLLVHKDVARIKSFLSRSTRVQNCFSDYRYLDLTAGQWQNAYESLTALLKISPGSDLWDCYVSAAMHSGHGKEAAKRLETAIGSPAVPAEVKRALVYKLANISKALGDVAKGSGQNPVWGWDDDEVLGWGLALGDQRLVEQALPATLKKEKELTPTLTEALFAQHRFAELEQRALQEFRGDVAYGQGEKGALLLCRIYKATNRPEQILSLLSDAPIWDQRDLADSFHGYRYGHGQSWHQETPVTYYAAWAFAKSGKKELAVQILQSILRDENCEDAYELLNSLADKGTPGFYDSLAKGYPKAADPWIWKADLLYTQGASQEAARSLDAVLSAKMLESCGSFGLSAREFDVMATVLARINPAEASSCRRKSSALRLLNRGTRVSEEGFLPQARDYFERAVREAPGNASTELELADCLYKQGRIDAARKQYRACIADLPTYIGTDSYNVEDQFQELFESADTIRIGLEVLRKAPKSSDLDARQCYLRAMFEAAGGSKEQAVADLRRAVRISPNFVAAWQEMQEMAAEGVLDEAEAVTALRKAEVLGWRSAGSEHLMSVISDFRPCDSFFEPKPSVHPGPSLFALKMRSNSEKGDYFEWTVRFGYHDSLGRALTSDGTVSSIVANLDYQRQRETFERLRAADAIHTSP